MDNSDIPIDKLTPMLLSREKTVELWLQAGVDIQVHLAPLYPGVEGLPPSLISDEALKQSNGIVVLNIWQTQPDTLSDLELTENHFACVLSFNVVRHGIVVPFSSVVAIILGQGTPNEILLAWPHAQDEITKVIAATVNEQVDDALDILEGKKPKLKVV